jgi:signal transduction histidine kinase
LPIQLIVAVACVAASSVAASAAGCPAAPVELRSARFALAGDGRVPGPDAAFDEVSLPDRWRERRPAAGGLAWYRIPITVAAGNDPRCAVYLPDVNMNAAVFVDGQWIGEGGSLEDPVAHNFNRPLYFEFPATLLSGEADHVDVLLYAYAHHFGRLGPLWIGPHAALHGGYARALFRQITLAQIGTALAVVTACLVGTIWIGAGFRPLYGFFFASTAAWAVNSLNYWVSDIPLSHWAWDRLVNAALDQFAVFLALFFHRLVRVARPRTERALWAFAIAAALAAFATPRPYFADAMMVTHVLITMIGAYVTLLSWLYRERLSPAEARIYVGAWLLQLVFSGHDLGIQLGLWWGVGYTLPYTVSCMMLAFGTTLALRFVQALREARALNKTLEVRVREREEELSRQFARSRELEHRDILSRERQRLMREMHDGLGGQLVSSLALVEGGAGADPEVVAALRDSLDELRLVIFSLDPGMGEVPALLAALRGRLEPAVERRGARFRWRVGDAPTPARFGQEQCLNLLRIVQEAITNAVRHAAPTEIEVATSVADGSLVIVVRDDGRGFPPTVHRGRGLTNMEQRASELGGRIHFVSSVDGTRVELRLPLG